MLYVIDEAQDFIPSGAGALSKTSGVQLVAQARKYGLGMIAVTQAPKGIDNKVVSNCTTQFLGKQNSPTDQQSVKGMIAATGGIADDVGKLAAGEFYFKTEKSGKPFKLKTPICLSYHPPNPPTPEEVVARAKKSALTSPRESLVFYGRSISQSDFPSVFYGSTAPFALADQGTSEVGRISRPEAVERTTGMGCGCHPPE